MGNDKEILIEAIITQVKDGSVSMDLKGRLGDLTVPKRMLISDDKVEVGQEVRFYMTFPEVIKKEKNKKEQYNSYNL